LALVSSTWNFNLDIETQEIQKDFLKLLKENIFSDLKERLFCFFSWPKCAKFQPCTTEENFPCIAVFKRLAVCIYY